jgi:hypothetical protein
MRGALAADAHAGGKTNNDAAGFPRLSCLTSIMVAGWPVFGAIANLIISPYFSSTHTFTCPWGESEANTFVETPFSVAVPDAVACCLARSAFISAESANGSPQSPEKAPPPQGTLLLSRSQVKFLWLWRS